MAALMTKTDLTFSAFSLRFVDLAIQFCFCCKFSCYEKWLSSQAWQWHDFPGPITILVFKLCRKIFEIRKSAFCISLFLYHIKQIDSMLLCVCSEMDHRRCQNVARTSVVISLCATFLFLRHFDVICDLLLNKHTATWNLFVKIIYNE